MCYTAAGHCLNNALIFFHMSSTSSSWVSIFSYLALICLLYLSAISLFCSSYILHLSISFIFNLLSDVYSNFWLATTRKWFVSTSSPLYVPIFVTTFNYLFWINIWLVFFILGIVLVHLYILSFLWKWLFIIFIPFYFLRSISHN